MQTCYSSATGYGHSEHSSAWEWFSGGVSKSKKVACMPFIVPRPKLGHFGGGREIRQATSCMYETVHGPMSAPRMQAWVVGNVLTTAVVSCTGLSSILEKMGVKWRGKRERERKGICLKIRRFWKQVVWGFICPGSSELLVGICLMFLTSQICRPAAFKTTNTEFSLTTNLQEEAAPWKKEPTPHLSVTSQKLVVVLPATLRVLAHLGAQAKPSHGLCPCSSTPPCLAACLHRRGCACANRSFWLLQTCVIVQSKMGGLGWKCGKREYWGTGPSNQQGFSSRSCLGHTKEGASPGSSCLGPSPHFLALQEKPGCEMLVAHSIHVLPIDIWLILCHSCFKTFCNYLFIDVY